MRKRRTGLKLTMPSSHDIGIDILKVRHTKQLSPKSMSINSSPTLIGAPTFLSGLTTMITL